MNQGDDQIVYIIPYPLGQCRCSICGDDLPDLNLKIREHVSTLHGIDRFSYKCKICGTSLANINGIKSHAQACKRKQKAAVDAGESYKEKVLARELEQRKKTLDRDTLECPECRKQQAIFVAKNRKGLVTHMRTKHKNAYEDSKTVAMKRVAWNSDEDKILAKMEILLKKQHKGQILDRLYQEWNKTASRAQGNYRSKEAIRGRRQQPEYKAILSSMLILNTDKSDSESTGSETTLEPDTEPENNYQDEIKKILQDKIMKERDTLPGHVSEVIKVYLDRNSTIDPVEQSMRCINTSLTEIREKIRPKQHPKRSKKEIKNKSRLQKAKSRAYLQHLYAKNKPRLVEELIDGISGEVDPPPIPIAIQHYRNIWSRDGVSATAVDPSRGTMVTGDTQVLYPITKDEILAAIKRTKSETAKGLDNITIQEAKKLVSNELFVAFNIWFACSRIPKEIKMNRTTLLPKGNTDHDKITNWRPITISSILLRLYNKILCKRLEKIVRTDDRQLGFKPLNGCSLNIQWLQQLLKHARLHKKDLYICLIDVAKAFDSVPHSAILNALDRTKVPATIINIIRDQYKDSTTTIVYKDLCSRRIPIKQGVKQGDPLSPLLFNLVIDELMGKIGDQYGYSIDGIGSTNIKCFADDICLVSGSRMGMNQLIETTSQFLEEKGLTINANKCITIGIAKGFKGKKSKIITESIFTVKGSTIPMLGYTENRTKYLGIKFSSTGTDRGKDTHTQIATMLQKLATVPLKPQQKISLLRTHIIPRVLYQLINIEIYPEFLKKVDLLIRKSVRTILHLNQGLSTEFFSLPVREGGLQIPAMREIVGLAKVRIYKYIMRSNDNVLKYLMEVQGFPIIRRFISDLKLTGSYETADIEQCKQQLMRERRLSYSQKVHGHGNEVFSSCPLSNAWLHGDCATITGRTFINSIKLRTNTLETRVTQARGLLIEKLCRRCKAEPESIMHVLQFCNGTRGLRCQRHDRLCSKISRKLKERGFTVHQERRFAVTNNGMHILKPDIIAIKNQKVKILDVQIVYETSGAAFTNAYQRKVEKYKQLIEPVKNEYSCTTVEIHGLIMGARGSFHHGQLSIWHDLQMTKTDLQYLAIGSMEESLRIMYTFWKSVGELGHDQSTS